MEPVKASWCSSEVQDTISVIRDHLGPGQQDPHVDMQR